jgi:hypothetical protein
MAALGRSLGKVKLIPSDYPVAAVIVVIKVTPTSSVTLVTKGIQRVQVTQAVGVSS